MLKIEQMVNKGNRELYSIDIEIHGVKLNGIFEKIEIDETEIRPKTNGVLILIDSDK